jgi:hypothetical protein
MGNLDEQACAITGFGIATTGTTVGEINKDLNALLNDFVGLLAFNICDETHSAGIVLVAGMI